MREGKTAYVQGELIEGTIPDNPITVFKFDNLNVFPLELSLKGTYNTTNLELSSTIPTNPTTSISIDEKTEFPLTIPTANTYNTRDLTITSSVVPTNPYEYFGKMCMQQGTRDVFDLDTIARALPQFTQLNSIFDDVGLTINKVILPKSDSTHDFSNFLINKNNFRYCGVQELDAAQYGGSLSAFCFSTNPIKNPKILINNELPSQAFQYATSSSSFNETDTGEAKAVSGTGTVSANVFRQYIFNKYCGLWGFNNFKANSLAYIWYCPLFYIQADSTITFANTVFSVRSDEAAIYLDCDTVPTIGTTTFDSNLICTVYVKDSIYDETAAATNWASMISKGIVTLKKHSEYTGEKPWEDVQW